MTMGVRPPIALNAGWNPLWKQSAADAIYVPNLAPLKNSAGGADRFIGQQFSLDADWRITEHLGFGATFVHFVPGARTIVGSMSTWRAAVR